MYTACERYGLLLWPDHSAIICLPIYRRKSLVYTACERYGLLLWLDHVVIILAEVTGTVVLQANHKSKVRRYYRLTVVLTDISGAHAFQALRTVHHCRWGGAVWWARPLTSESHRCTSLQIVRHTILAGAQRYYGFTAILVETTGLRTHVSYR